MCEVYGNGSDCVYMLIANHLIANGVEIFNAEDEKVLKMARQRAMEAHGDLRYLQGVKFGVESATKHGRWIDMGDFQSCSICQAARLKEIETHYGKAVWLKTPFCPDCGARMDGE